MVQRRVLVQNKRKILNLLILLSPHRTEGNYFLLHLPLPQLQQKAAVLLVEGAGVGQEARGQKDVSNQVLDLSLEPGTAGSPTDLERKIRTDGEIDNGRTDGWMLVRMDK